MLKRNLISVWELDETTGTIVYGSHRGINGENYNGNVLINQPGKINKSYLFSGTFGERIVIEDNPPIISHKLTIMAWIKYSDLLNDSGSGYIASKWIGSPTADRSWVLSILNSKHLDFAISTNGSYNPNYELVSSDILSTLNGVWNHVAGVYDGQYLRIYLNGDELISKYVGDIYPEQNTQGIIIGSGFNINSNQYTTFKGNIDQVALWDRALFKNEISIIYNSGNGLAYSSW